ncbi:hypothetical protein GCM10025879_20270 [Leuconostoc litchii]|uniref:Prophage tail endopeptidase domain-containing protein n=1 Tax=Leuconostoc litchii TaxID=1981069 RepID=A0A6P2CRD0_9LACO|nr:hypothetical protein [Leuconostoc litchii]TYC46877.1 hypothetical protein ESZ47_01675 [Leuconostoc litchii]GMA68781.1 hypothetical protein GCM10025879_00270 [Leuconostoc litchii]GMA70781.1 hypothetical protein GCM10025879_20270 [Leuconostoc litchii]
MSLSLQITVFNGDYLTIRGTYPLLSYEIQMDALSNATSTFTVVKNSAIETGDYVAVKKPNTATIMYYGQLTTVDTDDATDIMTLTANYIWNVLNGDILVGNKSGDSYESHLVNLMKNYFTSTASTNVLSYSLFSTTSTPFAVTSSDITTSNFIDYMIRGFKLHNVIFDVTEIGQGMLNGIPFYYPKVTVHQVTDVWNIKNDIYDFINWNVSDSRYLRGYNNELKIVDKDGTNMENPSVLSTYWLQADGTITNKLNDNVIKPTQVQLYLFDKTATDNPTYDSIASSNLSGNTYSHSIQFSTSFDNNFLPLSKIKLGLQSNIYYNGKQYKSVLSAYSLSSSSDLINLTFGNLRFGKSDLFSTT